MPYCKASEPCSERTLWQASSKRFTGKTSGAGRPPPKEMISGFCVTFKSSRIAELLTPRVRCAYRDFQSVAMRNPPHESRFQSFRVSRSQRSFGFVLETFETLKLQNLATSSLVLSDQFWLVGHMHMGMGVGVVFLRVDHGDGRHIHHVFGGCGAMHDVDGTAHSHQD